jgi:hypothetical protein
MSDFTNLFISNTNMSHIDDKTGTKIELTQFNVSKYFKDVYLLVKKNNNAINPKFYNMMITKELFEEVSKNLMLYKVSVKCLKNKNHFANCIMLSNEQLVCYNVFNYTLDVKNIVLPIFNVEYMNLIKYFEQYESSNTLKNIYSTKVLNNYFNMTTNFKSSNYICNMIANMEETSWWTNNYNCMFNSSKKFKERMFSTQFNYLSNKNLAQVIKKITEKKKSSEMDTKEENYIEDIDIETKSPEIKAPTKMKQIMEKFNVDKYITSSEFSKDDIYQLFLTLDKKEQFMLYAYLMISPKYCHLVTSNGMVMKLMQETEMKFAHMFRYIKSYAFIELYKKECIRTTTSSHNTLSHTDECVFKINDANMLLVYPFNYNQPKMNPYMPILVSDSLLKPSENFIGIPDYGINKDISLHGITSLDKFKTLMNIFTTSNAQTNLFDNIDFKKLECCITGGIMSACLQEKHPLLSRFKNHTGNINDIYKAYFNEYYCTSDIDVMFKVKDNFIFIDNVTEFYNMIVLNLCKFNPSDVDPQFIKLKLNKIGYVFVSEKYIDSMKSEYTPLYIKENINEENIKMLFKSEYMKLAQEYIDKLPADTKDKYPDVYNIDVDFKVYVNKDKTSNVDISLSMTYKYKIESPYLNHKLELFPIKQDDFMNVVSSFHLPCVRGYYDGNDVYMTTSCVIAHMTLMNIDYKYFTGTKDSYDIILKYALRGGWGLWMNQSEKSMTTEYCKNVPFWNNLYSIFPETPTETAMNAIFGPKSLNHKLFRPRFYNMDDYASYEYVELADRYNNAEVPNIDINTNIDILITNKFKTSNNIIDYSKFISINKDGYVVPVKKYVIEMTWEMQKESDIKSDYKFKKSVKK